MEFSVNHPILFVLVGIIIAAVIGQSVYFLVKAYKRAKEKGMDMSTKMASRIIPCSRSLPRLDTKAPIPNSADKKPKPRTTIFIKVIDTHPP